MGFILSLIFIAVPVCLLIVPMWKVFEKAGKPGWASIVPIYNMIVMVEIAKKPTIWVLFLLIPLAQIYFGIVLMNEISKAFGKDTGFTVGLILLPIVFWPILGYGDAQYTEPADPIQLV